ncbi:helix-turn-helix transcriptional regulator [Sphingobacterium shayense]|uniref:AraC family transcriptional regulator n=1 Tax=Sphingobacterium shayense TaxID=626343 RepID=UPI0015571BA1|nr:AraC family transcriptional regulator [Sphingobacterium shayense]NQD71309.1 helix-turn-helix transcriptional regulator [Sphingobacterium shayense]
MQNANIKCGQIETRKGQYLDDISKNAYVWHEKNWKHDDYGHQHKRAQLTYVEEGYQYFHINKHIFLVPQNHVIWVPPGIEHRITSEAKTVDLTVVLYKSVPENDFFHKIQVFSAPPVLKEMLKHAIKWSQWLEEDEEQAIFLQAILISIPSFCKGSNYLQVPVPTDIRLLPVCDYLNSNFVHKLNLARLAETAKLSVRTLQRIFKQETGITLQKYVQLIRILKSIEMMDTKRYNLSQIAFSVGYKSLSAYTASYFSVMKSSPKLRKCN